MTPRGRSLKLAAWLVVVSGLLVSGRAAKPQRRRGAMVTDVGTPWVYDGAFVFCRIAFRQSPDGDGNGWSVDYPRADLNFPFRLGQLTGTPISRDRRGEPNHVVVSLTDPHLFECPFVMMTEPGGAYFDREEAAKLREYIDKGGFLWADDFWGEYAWASWEREIRKAFPANEFPIIDLPKNHPIFTINYWIKDLPQIPSIDFWFGSGYRTSERADSQTPHARAILNARGYVVVLMTHNTDFGDAFEREGENRAYFDRFASLGYAFGINVLMYAMSH